MTEYIIIASTFGLGYFFQSLFGFGGALIIILILSVFVPVQHIIGMLPISVIIATGYIFLRELDKVRWKPMLTCFIAAVPGVVLGAYLLPKIPTSPIVIAICITMLAYSFLTLFAKQIKIPEKLVIPILLIAGFVSGTTGLGIVFVPIILQEITDPKELRVSLNFLWCILGVFRLPMYIANGVIVPEYAYMSLYIIPIIMITQYFGKILHKTISPEKFHTYAQIFLIMLISARLIKELV